MTSSESVLRGGGLREGEEKTHRRIPPHGVGMPNPEHGMRKIPIREEERKRNPNPPPPPLRVASPPPPSKQLLIQHQNATPWAPSRTTSTCAGDRCLGWGTVTGNYGSCRCHVVSWLLVFVAVIVCVSAFVALLVGKQRLGGMVDESDGTGWCVKA